MRFRQSCQGILGEERTHILPFDFCPTFFETVLYIFLLVSLVVSQTSDEVVETLLKPGISLDKEQSRQCGFEGRTW